jgi:hypothetical protein
LKIRYLGLSIGTPLMLQKVISEIKEEYPIEFSIKVSTCRGALPVPITDIDFIYFEFSRELLYTFKEECFEILHYRRPKFFNLSLLDIDERKEVLNFLTKHFSFTEFDVFFQNHAYFFKFYFLKFLLSLPRKRVIFRDNRVVEFDFFKKEIVIREGGKFKKLFLSNTEAEILRELLLAWEENKKYVREFRAEEVSSEGSLAVLLSRLRRKLTLFTKGPLFSIKKDRKKGYFLVHSD